MCCIRALVVRLISCMMTESYVGCGNWCQGSLRRHSSINVIAGILMTFTLLMPTFTKGDYGRTFMTAPNMMTIDNNQVLFYEIIQPDTLKYLFKMSPAKNLGAPFINKRFYHSKLVPVIPSEACSEITNPFAIQGGIALIKRGGCSFTTKSQNVERVGAIAMFVMDHDKDNDHHYIEMIHDNTGRKSKIPAGFILGRDGYHIQRALQLSGMQYAIINAPVNVTTAEIYLKQPPWTVW